MKRALITGIAGQDGSYLAEFLIGKGYEVHGIVRSDVIVDPANPYLWRLGGVLNQIKFHNCSLNDVGSVTLLLQVINPVEIYHLASNVVTNGLLHQVIDIYEANVSEGLCILHSLAISKSNAKLYIAGSCLMFGKVLGGFQDIDTAAHPNTPYGIAKNALFNLNRMYRDQYDLFTCVGILYNHESIRRSFKYLPRKVTIAVARIKLGKQKKLYLGDVDVQRDWSYAGDIVNSMWMMLQQKSAKDFVVGSGKLHSIRELLQVAFSHVGLNWEEYVEYEPSLIRSQEQGSLCANITEISSIGWVPKLAFNEMITEMVDNDLRLEKKGVVND